MALLFPQGVRKDRGRITRRDKRRTGAMEKSTKESEHRKVAPQDGRKQSGGGSAGGGRSSVTDIPPDQVLNHTQEESSKKHISMDGAITQFEDCVSFGPRQVLLLLQGAEPPILCSRQKLSRPYTEVTMMMLLTSMADKELVHMIAWAKKLPGKARVTNELLEQTSQNGIYHEICTNRIEIYHRTVLLNCH